jgi:tetratricopeptide (TPR) repeat protein
MYKKLIIVLIIVSMFFSSCKTAEFGHLIVNVNGMIYDFSNKPISNYTIIFEESTEGSLVKKYTSISDINGRFYLPKIPADTYNITGTKEGYETYKGSIFIDSKEQIIYLRIPSLSQLLDLADQSLNKHNIPEAESYIERASQIGGTSTEFLFYSAVISFRKKEYQKAIDYLNKAKEAGSSDLYIEKFLNDLINLMEKDNENS